MENCSSRYIMWSSLVCQMYSSHRQGHDDRNVKMSRRTCETRSTDQQYTSQLYFGVAGQKTHVTPISWATRPVKASLSFDSNGKPWKRPRLSGLCKARKTDNKHTRLCKTPFLKQTNVKLNARDLTRLAHGNTQTKIPSHPATQLKRSESQRSAELERPFTDRAPSD